MNRLIQIGMIALIFASCTVDESKEQRIPEWLAVRESSEPADCIKYIQSKPDSKYLWDALTRYWFLTDSLDSFAKGGRMNADINWNGSDKYLINGILCNADSLRLLSLEYLLNERPEGSPHKSVVSSNGTESFRLSNGRFDFAVYRNEVELPSMQRAILAVSEGVTEYAEHLAIEVYKTPYDQLTVERRKEVDSWIGDRLNFYDFRFMDRNPSLPVEEDQIELN